MSTVREPLAVVGVSAIFPGSVDRYGFWHDILQEAKISFLMFQKVTG